MRKTNNADEEKVEVVPRTGSVLVFQQDMMHEGSLLEDGVKYTLTTDVLYENRDELHRKFFLIRFMKIRDALKKQSENFGDLSQSYLTPTLPPNLGQKNWDISFRIWTPPSFMNLGQKGQKIGS